MKKSKRLLFLLIASTVVSATAVAFASVSAKRGTRWVSGTDGAIWNHYSAVAPTFEKRGSKEYWVNCSTHESVFSAPASENIVDKGAPTREFIDSLASNDSRLVERYFRGFNFDDGVNPYITIKSGFEALEIVDGEGVDGSKALRASRSTAGDSFLRISKDYLDMIFADPNVKSLSFAAKAHNPTNNFRHIKVNASYVNNNSDIVECFERNATNWGITTEYKTFYLTRGVYSQMDMSNGSLDYFLKFGAGSVLPQYLYLDDFKLSDYDYYDYTFNSFETGYFSGSEIKDPIVNQKLFSISASTNQGFDYDVRTEGVRSFRSDKVSGENAYYLGVGARSLLQEGDYLTFDFRGTKALNNTNEGIRDGNRTALACLTSSFPADKWVTLSVPKSGITSDGRFLIIGTSTTGTYWIDNLRINKASYSFEDARYTSLFGNYANVSHYEIENEAASNTLRDTTKDFVIVAEWGGWSKIEITNEKANHGAYSLKLSVTAGDKPIRAVPAWYNIMDEDSVFSFDIYSDDMTFTGKYASVVKGTWTTISFTKAEFGANYRIFDNSTNKLSKGTMYLDNFRLVL